MHGCGLSLLAVASAAFAQIQDKETPPITFDTLQATARTDSPTSNVAGHVFDRFVTIWLENTDYEMAIADPNFYLLSSLGITLNNSYAVTHPSQPNYCAAVGGDYFGMDNNDFTIIDQNVSTIVDLLESRQISWSVYQEDMPFSGFLGETYAGQVAGANAYVRKHNPLVHYNSVVTNEDRRARMKNLTMFYSDLDNGRLPQWMFITPNMEHDGHDTNVTVAGLWAANFLQPLFIDKRFMDKTLVLITFDENASLSKKNRILSLLVGDAVPEELRGTTDANHYSHYSQLATVEANWGLSTLGRWDAGASVYKFVAERTGDSVRSLDESSPNWWNLSYDGVFNKASRDRLNPKPKLVYPAPNLFIPVHSRFILPAIRRLWEGRSYNLQYYEDTIFAPDGVHPPKWKEGKNPGVFKNTPGMPDKKNIGMPGGMYPPSGYGCNIDLRKAINKHVSPYCQRPGRS